MFGGNTSSRQVQTYRQAGCLGYRTYLQFTVKITVRQSDPGFGLSFMPVSLTVGQSLSGISQTAPVRSVLMAGAVSALAGKGVVGHTHSVSSPGGLVEFACQPEVGD